MTIKYLIERCMFIHIFFSIAGYHLIQLKLPTVNMLQWNMFTIYLNIN